MIDCDWSPDETTRIIAFLGYGRPSAPVWFIGMEEGLGGMSSTDCCKNLKARATFESTMDLRKAHLLLVQGGIPIDIEENTPSTQVWQYMAKIMLARQGDLTWRNAGSYKRYVKTLLGRENGDTFLTEISPIPSKNATGKEWNRFFRQKDPDLDAKLKLRYDELRKQIKDCDPTLIICYGINRRRKFGELLGGVEWQPIFEDVYASPDRRRLLVPFFGNGQMSHKVIERMLEHGLLKASES